MNKYLQDLVVLSKIDQEIDSFQPRLEEAAKELKESETKLKKLESTLDTYDEELKELKKERIKNDESILKNIEKIKNIDKKLGKAKTEKEINALRIERDIAKDYQEAAGIEIERIDKFIENKEKEIQECKSSKGEIENNHKNIDKAAKTKLSSIKKERESIFAKRTELISSMNAKILTFYEKIRKWAKNTAVVPVRKQACYGCFMKIYDKTYLNIIKGKEIITCPHCGRILYKEPDDC